MHPNASSCLRNTQYCWRNQFVLCSVLSGCLHHWWFYMIFMKQLHNQIQIKVSARSSFSGKIIGFSSITAQWWWMWEQAETWCVTTNHTDSFPVRRKEEKATYFLSLGGNGNHQQYFVLHIASVLLYLPEKYHCDYISQNLHWSGVYCDPIFSSSFSMSTSSSIYSKNYFQLR